MSDEQETLSAKETTFGGEAKAKTLDGSQQHPSRAGVMSSIRTPLKLGKKKRLGEKIIESSIKGLAFTAFAAIILIFVFVFREALPMFSSKDEPTAVVDSTTAVTSPSDSLPSHAVVASEPVTTKDRFKATTKVETKVSVTGEKVKVTKNGGQVEQEVYDPLADDEPASNGNVADNKPKAETVAADSTKKVSSKKNESKGALAQKSAKEKTDTLASLSKTSSEASKKDLTYTKITNGGKVEQEVYDPFANETGIATIKSKGKAKTDTATLAEATVDSAAIKLAQSEVDSAKAKELREAEERKHATSLSNLLGTTWQPVSTVPKYGLIPLFVGTLKVTLLSILFGAPIAILAALFTSTFAPKWLREIVKPAIELLAGFPSVVIGFFALIVLATVFQNFFGYQFRLNSFLGGVAMSFAVIPIIYTIAEDALVAVPQSLREASDALGASKWQTAFKVVLPAAVPGVFAAIVLGFGRAFGETMIALMATGNAPLTSLNILEPVRTFSATIGAEMAEVVFGDEHYNVLFFIGSLLFIFTFTLNSIVEFWVRKRLLARIQGKVA